MDESSQTTKNGRDKKANTRTKAVDLLVNLGKTRTPLFHDDQRTAYASVCNGARIDAVKIKSSAYSEWLEAAYYEVFRTAAGAHAVRDACSTLAACAVHGAPEGRVHMRTAPDQGAILLDLATACGEVVRITRNGWAVETNPGVYFRRPRGIGALPVPIQGVSVDALRPFVNVHDEGQFRLVVAFIIAALKPTGPYPLLALQGEHGVGKSLVTRFLRGLIDPNSSPVRAAPREPRDLAVSARSAHLLAFDNLSGLPPWLSDALCRLSTGGGFATRELYSNDEEVVLEACRPVILNGIDDIATRPDLADRCLAVSLSPIQAERRRREADLVGEFERAAPGILGALLTAVAGALIRENSVVLCEPPRLADFAHFVTSAEPALGWPDGAFMDALRSNQRDAASIALDASPVARYVEQLVRKEGLWEGTASDLRDVLKGLATSNDFARLPSTSQAMSNALRRLAPLLRQAGVSYEARRTNRSRLIVLRLASAERSSLASRGAEPDGIEREIAEECVNGSGHVAIHVLGDGGVSGLDLGDGARERVTEAPPLPDRGSTARVGPGDEGDERDAPFYGEEEERHAFSDLLDGGSP